MLSYLYYKLWYIILNLVSLVSLSVCYHFMLIIHIIFLCICFVKIFPSHISFFLHTGILGHNWFILGRELLKTLQLFPCVWLVWRKNPSFRLWPVSRKYQVTLFSTSILPQFSSPYTLDLRLFDHNFTCLKLATKNQDQF